jgi:uncharacterized small protein (DUF1192 family)
MRAMDSLADTIDLTRIRATLAEHPVDEQWCEEWGCAEIRPLVAEIDRFKAELAEERQWREGLADLSVDQQREIERLKAVLRDILEDPDVRILDSHRDDGWEALNG